MGICLQVAWRQSANPTVSVPAPCDAKTPGVDWWYDHVAKQCATMAANGITAILLPPVLKTNAGQFPGADGYGVYDDYDVGSKEQFFSRNTRFGTDEQLRRCIAIAAANGIDAYADFVPHQRMGGSYGEYRYLGADGKTPNGRFTKHKSYFRGDPAQGYAAEDPVADVPEDFSFGDELLTVNSTPKGAVLQGLIDAGDWLVRTLGLKGGRIDDTKGQVPASVRKWATSKAMAGLYWFGEYADGNPDSLNWWVWDSGMAGTVSTADFAFHYRVKDICEGAGRWDMRGLLGIGFLARSSTKALTFVESPDTDTNGFGGIRWNKALAYFLMLTLPGYPCIYYRDWSTDANCYGGGGLGPNINNAAWIATHLVSGDIVQRYADYQVCVYERTGGPRLLCGVNNDPGNWHSQWVPTGFGPNVHLHDYTGHAADVWTNQDGWAYLSIPPNDNGLGTVAYSRAGLSKATVPGSRACSQTFFGASDLDIGPMNAGDPVIVGRIWCAADKPITFSLTHPAAAFGNEDEITLHCVGPTKPVLIKDLEPDTTKAVSAQAHTTEAGWHTIVLGLTSKEVPALPFELTVTYTATKTL